MCARARVCVCGRDALYISHYRRVVVVGKREKCIVVIRQRWMVEKPRRAADAPGWIRFIFHARHRPDPVKTLLSR